MRLSPTGGVPQTLQHEFISFPSPAASFPLSLSDTLPFPLLFTQSSDMHPPSSGFTDCRGSYSFLILLSSTSITHFLLFSYFYPIELNCFFNFVHLLLVCQKIPFNFISFYTFYRIIVILVRHDHMVVKQTEASWPGPLRSGSALEPATPPPANFPKFERSQLSV